MNKTKVIAGIGLIAGATTSITALILEVDGPLFAGLIGFMTLCLGILTGTKVAKINK